MIGMLEMLPISGGSPREPRKPSRTNAPSSFASSEMVFALRDCPGQSQLEDLHTWTSSCHARRKHGSRQSSDLRHFIGTL